MSIPNKTIQPLVLDLLAIDPVPNSEYTYLDLQMMAYTIRLLEGVTPELLAAANALDGLSDLESADVKFIRSAGSVPVMA